MKLKSHVFSLHRFTPFLSLTTGTILTVYLLLTVGLVALMTNGSFPPAIGLVGAFIINLVALLFIRGDITLPLYLLIAGPSVSLALSNSGILSRLYLGNIFFFLMTVIWLITKVLAERKTGRWLLRPALLVPLLGLIISGLVSIVFSHLFPDPNVSYTFPHANTSLYIVNAAEMMILVGLPFFLIIVPGLVHSARQAYRVIIAYMIIGSLYALGVIFAAPLGLYSSEVILGVRRPEVFGSISSGLGTLLTLFACIALCQAFYATKNMMRLLWSILSILFGFGVIMTFGRESWIALFLSAMTVTIIYTKNWKILVAVLGLLIPILTVSGIASFFDPSQTYGSDRFVIWQDAITIWQHSPIIGIGAGNYQFFNIAYGKDVVGIAHNQYLQILAEMGILGLFCLLWTMGAVLWISIKSFRAAKSRMGKAIALAYLSYFCAIIFGGFFTSSFVPSAANGGGTEAFISASYRWLLLGLVLSIPQWERETIPIETVDLTTEPPKQITQSEALLVAESTE